MTTLALALLMTLDTGSGPIDPGVHYPAPAPKVHHVRRKVPTTQQGPRVVVVSFGYCFAYFLAMGLDSDLALMKCATLRR